MLLLIGLIAFSSCKKAEEDNNVYSSIAVVNASPTTSTYDIYLGGVKVNAAAVPSGGAIGYQKRVTGDYEVKFTVAGRAETIYAKSLNLPPNAFQSFFLVGKAAALDYFSIVEDSTPGAADKAYVRFVNVSPDAPALDLVVKDGASIATNKTFKTASAFTAIAPGTYTFNVKETSTGNIKTSSESVAFAAGTYYTVLAKGLVAPGVNELPLSASVIVIK